jgi:hypothetical protein
LKLTLPSLFNASNREKISLLSKRYYSCTKSSTKSGSEILLLLEKEDTIYKLERDFPLPLVNYGQLPRQNTDETIVQRHDHRIPDNQIQ